MKMTNIYKFLALVAILGFSFFAFGKRGFSGNNEGFSRLLDDMELGPYSPALMTKEPFNDKTAVDFVAGMKIGWNLGNTLDAHGDDNGFHWLGGGFYDNTAVSEMEGAWLGGRVTTLENIKAVKDAGFDIIRIPVTWYKAADSNFNIRKDWMERVTEIVNYAYDQDMYVILNTHHDESIFKFMNRDTNKSLEVFRKIWMQIAAQFKNYGERLIFEGLNEPRTKGSGAEWNGGTQEERRNLNKHYEVFVDVVRNSGGNNDKRFLMISTYGASSTQNAMAGLALPKDTASNKLIVSIHFYEPYNFALRTGSGTVSAWDKNNSADTNPITSRIDRAFSIFVSKGIPVIIGEMGAMNRENEAARAEWAEFYVSYAKSKGLPCIWWDNGATAGGGERFGILNRSTNVFHFPSIISGLMKGAEL